MAFELVKAILKAATFDDFSPKITDFAKNQAKSLESSSFFVAKVNEKSEITQKVNCACRA